MSGGAYHYMMQAVALEKAGHQVHTVTNIRPQIELPRNEVSPGFYTEKKSFDVVISNHYRPVPIAFHKAKEEKAKYVMTMCEPPTLLAAHPLRRHESLRPEWDEFVTDVAQKADGIITISDFCKQAILKWVDNKKVFCHYPQINWEMIRKTSRKKITQKDQFVFISRLDQYKNIDWAVKASAILGKRLIVIGGGAYSDIMAMYRYAQSKGAQVIFNRWVSEQEKFSIIRQSRVLVHPSSFEGFGLPPVEAAACGVPAVCGDLPVYNETLQNACVKVNNFDRFVLELEFLFDNAEYAQNLGKTAQKKIENFYQQHDYVKTINQVIKEVV